MERNDRKPINHCSFLPRWRQDTARQDLPLGIFHLFKSNAASFINDKALIFQSNNTPVSSADGISHAFMYRMPFTHFWLVFLVV